MAGNFVQGAMQNALSVQADPSGAMGNAQRAFAGSGNLALKLTTLIDQEEINRQNQQLQLGNQVLEAEQQVETSRHNLAAEANAGRLAGVAEGNLGVRKNELKLKEKNARDYSLENAIKAGKYANSTNKLTLNPVTNMFEMSGVDSDAQELSNLAMQRAGVTPSAKKKPRLDIDFMGNPITDINGQPLSQPKEEPVAPTLSTALPTVDTPKTVVNNKLVGPNGLSTDAKAQLGNAVEANKKAKEELKLELEQETQELNNIKDLKGPAAEIAIAEQQKKVAGIKAEELRLKGIDKSIKDSVKGVRLQNKADRRRKGIEANQVLFDNLTAAPEKSGKNYKLSSDGESLVLKEAKGKAKEYVDLVKTMYPEAVNANGYVNPEVAQQYIVGLMANDPIELFARAGKLDATQKAFTISSFVRHAKDTLTKAEGYDILTEAVRQGYLKSEDITKTLSPLVNAEEMARLNTMADAVDHLGSRKSQDSYASDDTKAYVNDIWTNNQNDVETIKEIVTQEGLIDSTFNWTAEPFVGTDGATSDKYRSTPVEGLEKIEAYRNAKYGFSDMKAEVKNMRNITTGETFGITQLDTDMLLKDYEKVTGKTVPDKKVKEINDFQDYVKALSRSKAYAKGGNKNTPPAKVADEEIKKYRSTHPDYATQSMTKILTSSMSDSDMSELRHDIHYSKNKTQSEKNLGSLILMLDVSQLGNQKSHINDFFETMVDTAGNVIDTIKGN